MRFILILCALSLACTDEPNSLRTLKSHGFTDIKFTGVGWFSCSDSDSFSTAFTAKNANGVAVNGTVCCGLLKSCTVRF